VGAVALTDDETSHPCRRKNQSPNQVRIVVTHALVVGATSGIGRAFAVALAREGAKVVVSSRNRQRSII